MLTLKAWAWGMIFAFLLGQQGGEAMKRKLSDLGPRRYCPSNSELDRPAGAQPSLAGGLGSSGDAPPSLRGVLADLFLSNQNSAVDIQRVADAAGREGATSSRAMGKAGAHGKFPANCARDVMRELLRGVQMPALFWSPVPIWDKANNCQVIADFPLFVGA